MHPIGTPRLVFSCIQRQQDVYRPFFVNFFLTQCDNLVTSDTASHTAVSQVAGIMLAVTFDIIYSLSCLYVINYKFYSGDGSEI